jgi:hypothetical protein
MSNLNPATIFFLLICGHALADFGLQTEWIATNKNRHVRLSLSPEQRAKMQVIWPHLLSAHSLHHGLMVFLATQKLSLGVAETVFHWITDFGKCEKWYGFHTDQAIHVVTKVIWLILLILNVV